MIKGHENGCLLKKNFFFDFNSVIYI